ncbi:MAG: potassium transporter Kup, partial [Azovibrio sp.]
IGTSPLYTLKECFGEYLGLEINRLNVLGILSLIIWGLILSVSLKYLTFVLRADDKGEGGIFTLMALARRHTKGRFSWTLMILGLIGGGFFYGDAVITPAISVLSAIEGLQIYTPAFTPYILPLALTILIPLFLIQQHGTAIVGRFFGPIMALWFTVLAIMGINGILQNPNILHAINPIHAIAFMAEHNVIGFLALGTVVLALTGAEALYADLGHFGPAPIRVSWFSFVFPALVLNYLGQGAIILLDPEARTSPFFHLAPEWALLPLVILATAATVIASQAVISGVFSLTRQAILLGFIPRLSIMHTSDQQIGQIYIPAINWMLLFSVVIVVLAFQNSSNLAAAYGIAVTGTMVVTTILACTVARHNWNWSLAASLTLLVALLCMDIPLFIANIHKISDGGWLPILVGSITFLLTSTWKRGRQLLAQRLKEQAIPLDGFVENLETYPPTRIPGTAIFLNSTTEGVPHALLHNLKHNKVLHERVVIMTIKIKETPWVASKNRVTITQLSESFWQIIGHYGYKEQPNVKQLLKACSKKNFKTELMDTSFFLSYETIISTRRPGMVLWREKLFIWMNKNALRATDFFHVPTNRVLELGAQIEI